MSEITTTEEKKAESGDSRDEAGTDVILYLTFMIENELLALDVSQVREVLDLCPITRVPRTPEYMRGVINLRGSVIPVLDLRVKFGIASSDATIDSRVVVIELDQSGSETVVGLLTDSVQDVIEIHSDQINASPQMGARWRTEYICGIGKCGEEFILLLDIDRVFTDMDISVISESNVENVND